jgi:hypothetical protein
MMKFPIFHGMTGMLNPRDGSEMDCVLSQPDRSRCSYFLMWENRLYFSRLGLLTSVFAQVKGHDLAPNRRILGESLGSYFSNFRF